MTIQLADIASMVSGRLIGDESIMCVGANPPAQATEGEITMLEDPRRADSLLQSKAVAVITGEKIDSLQIPQIVVKRPHEAFASIVASFRPPLDQTQINAHVPSWGIAPDADIAETATIHSSAIIGENVSIGERSRIMPGVVVMPNCKIGDDCVIHANVTLYEYSDLGDRVVLHAGTVIGAHGFGYRNIQGKHAPTSQLGYVKIEDDVEIGASSTVDRGTYGATTIGEGTKIDNQVMIAHNCQIGKHNLICSQVGVAGSSNTGDYVVLAGQVGLKDHISLGDHTVVGAQAGVMEDCKGSEVLLGTPATTQRDQMQIMAVERRLPEMRREVKRLRKELDKLKAQTDSQCEAATGLKVAAPESTKKRAA
jgi:UDP-3-O-[3-hydroxymyristoyl] glucosamine N-acyltransferase